MQQNEKLTAIRIALGREEFRRNDELVFFCKNPHGCNGKHHNAKLSVNIKTDSFNCWVCGFSGKSLIGVLKLGNRDLFLRYLEEVKGKKNAEREEQLYDTPILPSTFNTLSKRSNDPYRSAAIGYLRSRGIQESDILNYKLGYCVDGDYRYRIIIPSFDVSGELNFFVGRKFYDNVGASYKHGEFDKNIIFNDYLIDWNEPVTIVEGPFDMMKAGENAIPLQGSIFPDKLFGKIVTLGVPVYMALDVDAKRKQINHMQKLISYGVEVHYVPISKYGVGDVGEMSKEQFQLAKKEAVQVKSDIDLLRMRVSA